MVLTNTQVRILLLNSCKASQPAWMVEHYQKKYEKIYIIFSIIQVYSEELCPKCEVHEIKKKLKLINQYTIKLPFVQFVIIIKIYI